MNSMRVTEINIITQNKIAFIFYTHNWKEYFQIIK